MNGKNVHTNHDRYSTATILMTGNIPTQMKVKCKYNRLILFFKIHEGMNSSTSLQHSFHEVLMH